MKGAPWNFLHVLLFHSSSFLWSLKSEFDLQLNRLCCLLTLRTNCFFFQLGFIVLLHCVRAFAKMLGNFLTDQEVILCQFGNCDDTWRTMRGKAHYLEKMNNRTSFPSSRVTCVIAGSILLSFPMPFRTADTARQEDTIYSSAPSSHLSTQGSAAQSSFRVMLHAEEPRVTANRPAVFPILCYRFLNLVRWASCEQVAFNGLFWLSRLQLAHKNVSSS